MCPLAPRRKAHDKSHEPASSFERVPCAGVGADFGKNLGDAREDAGLLGIDDDPAHGEAFVVLQVFVDVGVGQPRDEDAVLVERHVAFVRQQESGEEHGHHALAHAERRGGPHRCDLDSLHSGVDAREHLPRFVPELHESA